MFAALFGEVYLTQSLDEAYKSQKEKKWLDGFNNPNILRNEEVCVNGRYFIVDGYDPITNTIYEFDGDFWHGNPEVYDLNAINPKNKKTFGELYNVTMEKKSILKNAGYNIISVWEKDFDKLIKKS